MRVTMHSGKRGKLSHNDHDPKTKRAEWDKSKTKQNYLWSADGKRADGTYKTVAEAELDSYNRIYGKTLEEQNKRHLEHRQTGRVRNMSQWMETSQNKACETILQIGDKDVHADEDTLWNCAVEFVNWKQKRFKGVYSALSMSLHVDEATPHIHLRETWYYHDEQGNPHPGIKAALKEKGIALPDPVKKEGKDNYRKTTADFECREKWQSICKSHGLQIETEPLPPRQHMDKKGYKEFAEAQELLEREREALQRDREAYNASVTALKAQERALNEKEEKMDDEYEERVFTGVSNVLAKTRPMFTALERQKVAQKAFDSIDWSEHDAPMEYQ